MPAARTGDERTPLIRGNRDGNGRSQQTASQDEPGFTKWRAIVLTLLVIGYTAYYFCKTNLPLAIPHLEKEEGLSRTDIGAILSAGYIFYLCGKFISGYCVDTFGGKTTLLIGLAGSIATSVLFTFKVSTPWFATIRALNQAFSSVGWGACVKIVRRWYPPSKAAHAIAIASLAETLGDALVRVSLGSSLIYGFSWKEMFFLSAGIAGALFIPTFFVPGVPQDKGFDPPEETDQEAEEDMRHRTVFDSEDQSIWVLLKNTRIWLLSIELMGVILVRESFASFVSSLIASELSLSTGYSSVASAIFPAMGAVSSIAGGAILDKSSQTRRGLIPLVSLIGLTVSLVGMWAVTPSSAGKDSEALRLLRESGSADTKQIALFLIMIGCIALFLYAPKVIFDGAFVMDLAGGPEKVGMVTALVTGIGYLGGCVSPFVSGVLADKMGWPFAILLMAAIGGVISAAATVYWMLDLRKLRQAHGSGSA